MKNNVIDGFFSEIQTIPPVLQNSYFPSLDGLRGIAILMVTLFHLHLSWDNFYSTIFNGEVGVVIFFVLSGFLITTLCIKEKVTTKNISLKRFYIRRILRIFPVAYLYIVVIIILNFVFKLRIPYISILGAALYLMNISSFFRKYYSSYYTGHFWSLSVEEQFYLFVPIILKKKFKIYLIVLLSIVFIIPCLLVLQAFYPALNNNQLLFASTHYLIKFEPIAIGCLFSVLTFKYPLNNFFLIKTKVVGNLLAFFLIFFIKYSDNFGLDNMIKGFGCSILIGYIIITNIYPAKDIIFKFLNSKILKLIGILSYSIYIWQGIFTAADKNLPDFMTIFPYNFICLAIVSCLSYYFYESYFLKLKSKFTIFQKSKLETIA